MNQPNGRPSLHGPVADPSDDGRSIDRHVRAALSIYTSTFDDAEPAGFDTPGNLRYDAPVAALRAGLARVGYQITTVDDQSDTEIATVMARWLAETARPGMLRIVHVLSHGLLGGSTKQVQVAGRYGTASNGTALAGWLAAAADDGRGGRQTQGKAQGAVRSKQQPVHGERGVEWVSGKASSLPRAV